MTNKEKLTRRHEGTKGGGIATPGGEVVLYERDNAPAIAVKLDGDTVWLSQQQLADLFQTSRTNVVEHISNIYTEGELSQEATCREFRQVRTEGTREVTRTLPFYNLDLIISLGYKPFMGLLSFSGRQPTRADVAIAKNYLDANELKRLNTLVSAYFDAAEFRALNHEPTCMTDWLAHLEQLIAAMGGKALRGAGKVSHRQALTRAETEFDKYRSQQDTLPSEVETAYLETVKAVQRKIEGKPEERNTTR